MNRLRVALYDEYGNFVRFMEYGELSLKRTQSSINALVDDGMGQEQDRQASVFGDNWDSHPENEGSFQSEINRLTSSTNSQSYMKNIEFPKELEPYSIKTIQSKLNEFGYNLKVDGIYGPKTHSAVMTFGVDFLLEELVNSITEIPYIKTAKDELGTKEWGVGDNPEVLKYHNAVNNLHWGDDVPWCASFITWVMTKHGYKVPSYPARAKSWLHFGKSVGRPVYGAIAVKSRRGGGHVCFVIGATADDKYLYCLGGNQHDEVSIVKYRKDVFIDFRIPNDYSYYNIPLVDIKSQNIKNAGKEK